MTTIVKKKILGENGVLFLHISVEMKCIKKGASFSLDIFYRKSAGTVPGIAILIRADIQLQINKTRLKVKLNVHYV